MLSREDFESRLGPMSQLQAEAYLSDPRRLLADFYSPGDASGHGEREGAHSYFSSRQAQETVSTVLAVQSWLCQCI